jgi:hypothetical protein
MDLFIVSSLLKVVYLLKWTAFKRKRFYAPDKYPYQRQPFFLLRRQKGRACLFDTSKTLAGNIILNQGKSCGREFS